MLRTIVVLIGYLITTSLLFSLFTNSSQASTLQTSSDVKYEYIDNQFNTSLDVYLKNTSNNPAVLNYFTALLPYQGVDNIKVSSQGKLLSFTKKKLRNGTEINVSFKNNVIPKKALLSFNISFKSLSPINSNFGYGKLVTQIAGLNVNKVTFEYEDRYPKISYVQGCDFKEMFSSNNRKYEFSNIQYPTISFNIGNPVTFKYEFNKSYVNDSESTIVVENILPVSDYSQLFILENISPIPNTQRIDKDNNIILGFEIPAKEQKVINIKGLIQKRYDSAYNKFENKDLEINSYWSIKNTVDINRIDNYIKENNEKQLPSNLFNYVVEKLNTSTNTSVSINSFENATRLGAQSALDRKDYAIAEDYVDLLVATLRYQSIPSRMIVGILPESSIYTDVSAFHSWVEYFDEKENSWKLLDPSLVDIQKLKSLDTLTPNYIKLITRSSNALLPKLPFITSKDLIIQPTSQEGQPTFNYVIRDSSITNTGNIPIVISSNGLYDVVTPNTSKELSKGLSYTFTSFKGDSEILKIEDDKNGSIDLKIFVELTIFLISLILMLIVGGVYDKIKKLWRPKSDFY